MITSLHIANRGEFACRIISAQILPELVSGRGTAGRSPGVEGLPLAAELWRGKHSLRSCPSVTRYAGATSPRQARGGLKGMARA
jgi:hypothetical protein